VLPNLQAELQQELSELRAFKAEVMAQRAKAAQALREAAEKNAARWQDKAYKADMLAKMNAGRAAAKAKATSPSSSCPQR
jgi:hypothetical protein